MFFLQYSSNVCSSSEELSSSGGRSSSRISNELSLMTVRLLEEMLGGIVVACRQGPTEFGDEGEAGGSAAGAVGTSMAVSDVVSDDVN